MSSDKDHSGKPSRRIPSVPVPGMPYRLRSDLEDDAPAAPHRGIEFIESRAVGAQEGEPVEAYNPWEEQGWVTSGNMPPPARPEPDMPPEEQYLRPMLDLPREMPGGYADSETLEEYDEYDEYPPETYTGEPAYEETEYMQEPPPPPVPPKPPRRFEPWRTTVVLCCVAGLLFCGVEIYRIAQNIVKSETELRQYRELYLHENNEDFSRHAEAVALRPPGETYPPTASPVPQVTPTPTPRIAQNDPLIAAMAEGQPTQDPAATPEPVLRTTLERYPENPLLIPSDEIAALQVENEDIVGRLMIDGLLNEIVVQRNNTYYLNHNAMGAYSGYGAVFADETMSLRSPPENILLYGRTSNPGKVLEPLKGYLTGGLDFASRYAFLSLNTLYEDARYVIIAIVQASADPAAADYFDYKHLAFETDEEMLAFASKAIGRSTYIFNVPVAPTDRLLTLVTLSDGEDKESLIIVCRMLRDGEYDGYIQQN